MFWTFKFNVVVDILAFLGFETVWATFFKKYAIFKKSSGHPVGYLLCVMIDTEGLN